MPAFQQTFSENLKSISKQKYDDNEGRSRNICFIKTTQLIAKECKRQILRTIISAHSSNILSLWKSILIISECSSNINLWKSILFSPWKFQYMIITRLIKPTQLIAWECKRQILHMIISKKKKHTLSI